MQAALTSGPRDETPKAHQSPQRNKHAKARDFKIADSSEDGMNGRLAWNVVSTEELRCLLRRHKMPTEPASGTASQVAAEQTRDQTH
jgi:hypothetical protein